MRIINIKKSIITILLLACSFLNLKAQFYNGHQMDFGKNRVQYNDFYWEYYRFDRFDTYFYRDGRKIAKYSLKFIEKKLPEIENFFGFHLSKRIIFVIYNKQSEFKQSNIGLISGDSQYNTGGVTKIIDNKVFIYFEGDYKKLEKQIAAAIAEVIINGMLSGTNLKDKITTSTLQNIPNWYIKGLISYVSENWSFEIDDKVKNGILSGKYDKFNWLSGEDAAYAGHSIWNYIAQNYGKSVIPNILYLTRINKNADNGFAYILGLNIKEFTPLWLEYYKNLYSKQISNKNLPKEEGKAIKTKRNLVYQQVKLSPDGEYIAYTTNIMGKHKVWICNTKTGKRKKIIRLEHKIEQETDYSYPILGWHPKGQKLTIISEEKGNLVLRYYKVKTKEKEDILLHYFDKINSFSYSDNGTKMVFSAVLKGQTDIFVYNISAGSSERITQDLANDFNPRFIEKSEKIIFNSDRTSDTIVFEKNEYAPIARTHDLFVYDYKNKSKILRRVSNTKYINETKPYGISKNKYVYLSDKNGIINREIASFDSSINFIDTTIHYRYFTTTYPLTNYSRNINSFDINTKNNLITEILFNNKKQDLYKNELDLSKNSIKGKYSNTEFRNKKTRAYIDVDSLLSLEAYREKRQKEIADSIAKHAPESIKHPDSTLININHYVFENEKIYAYHKVFKTDSTEIKNKKDSLAFPKQKIYLTSFYPNYLVSQVDFGFLNASYQVFNGGPFYFNPGLNIFMKIGTNDLFENYKITGGFRFAGDLESNEYLLSLEDLKNRYDKQYIYHRQVISSYFSKIKTHKLMYILKYPFNQVMSLKGTFSMRYDIATLLATNSATLEQGDAYRVFSSIKLEYIFDNTISLGLNIYEGLRFKIFSEFHQQVYDKYDDIYVFGADFRYYLKIHRNLIFATRFAASTSFGKGKLIYYLGGVDSWTVFSQNKSVFDTLVRINQDENYVYQAVATNMRGFKQNVRNGTSFAVINTEIRWPIFRYFINRPINSSFINNFQIVGFADIGSAWSGLSPFSSENAYNKIVINNYPIRVTIDVDRSPFVLGYGFGVRSKIFGYFIRLDWAWGVEKQVVQPRMFYFSLSLDF